MQPHTTTLLRMIQQHTSKHCKTNHWPQLFPQLPVFSNFTDPELSVQQLAELQSITVLYQQATEQIPTQTHPIGQLRTHGEQAGARKVTSESREILLLGQAFVDCSKCHHMPQFIENHRKNLVNCLVKSKVVKTKCNILIYLLIHKIL